MNEVELSAEEVDKIETWLVEESLRMLNRCAIILAEHGLSVEQIDRAVPQLLAAINTWVEKKRRDRIPDLSADRVLH